MECRDGQRNETLISKYWPGWVTNKIVYTDNCRKNLWNNWENQLCIIFENLHQSFISVTEAGTRLCFDPILRFFQYFQIY